MKSNELIKQTHPLITPDHLRRLAIVYVRQSTEEQVRDNTGSTEYQRSLVEVARAPWVGGVADSNHRRGFRKIRFVR